MFGKNNYIDEAKKHEAAFRAILDKYQVVNKGMTIEEIYEKYSEGDRRGIWTILEFRHEEENIYYFSHEDVAILSGGGRADFLRVENGEVKMHKNDSVWMS